MSAQGCLFGVSSVSLRCLFGVSSVSLRYLFGSSSVSLRCLFGAFAVLRGCGVVTIVTKDNCFFCGSKRGVDGR